MTREIIDSAGFALLDALLSILLISLSWLALMKLTEAIKSESQQLRLILKPLKSIESLECEVTTKPASLRCYQPDDLTNGGKNHVFLPW